jgi:23S rRNA (pseudouridine1915-N3)-methyltransferase
MKCWVVAVGQKQPDWVNTAFHDYAARFPADQPLLLKEVKAEPRTTGKTVAAMKAAEAERILQAIGKAKTDSTGSALAKAGGKSAARLVGGNIITIALDERGRVLTTEEFAALIEKLQTQGGDLAFLIGGPDGLDEDLKSQCAHKIRLSSMTLPHGLARVLLAEQLYRAWSLKNNHPYHRA